MLLLFIGGGAGTIARYGLSGIMHQWLGPRFPFGTLTVNLLGCFLCGFLVVFMEKKALLSPDLRLFIVVGILGGFTTFSSFMLETSNLIRNGQTMLALWNILLSVCMGFILFRLGVMIGEII